MDCETHTDEELMERVLTERDVFSCIITRYEPKIRRYLLRLMPGLGEDADDVLQDIFIQVYVSARGFDTSLSFSSWMYRIAHNTAVSWLRKKKARPETIELGEEECHTFLASMEEAGSLHDAVLTRDSVTRTLAMLEEKYRTPLVLHFLEGKTYEEISDILEVPVGTVGTLVFRAKKLFIKQYTTHHA